ncbi:MAG: YidC/Oxa1 family membrane protein insertase [Candidatus Portnoybacteria bacterium]|nr:YidC/Oxa1 family membrane protein insertase [Candidatus Portnoybacteria bacterium]
MEFLSYLFNEVLYRPLFNSLIFLYNQIPGHDFGLAIIILTILIKLILFPVSQKAIKSQKETQAIQPKIKEIQEKYKNDREKQGRAMMELYKEHKVNPAAGCLPLIIQFLVLIAMFTVFRTGLDPEKLKSLYWFIERPETINHFFLGIVDLAKGSIIFGVLAGITQFIQSKMMMTNKPASGKNDFAGLMNKQMLYVFPVMTVFLGIKFPAGLALYWTLSNILTIIQQYFFLKKNGKQS